jgi:hypothetical protein
MRLPGENKSEPPGGRAGARLRESMEARYGATEPPSDAAGSDSPEEHSEEEESSEPQAGSEGAASESTEPD